MRPLFVQDFSMQIILMCFKQSLLQTRCVTRIVFMFFRLSELHSLGHKRDVMLRGEQESRHTTQQAALLPSPSLHFTPNQRTLPTDGESIPFGAPPGTEIAPVPRPDPPQQEGSSGLLGWLWGY